MGKLYWKIKAGGAFKPRKYQILYIVTNTKQMRTYPSNRWGYGYWKNKWK